MKVYLDNNATTLIDPRVLEAMLIELNAGPSNPSSAHTPGRQARARLSTAREMIAHYLKVPPKELFFTSGGTEALNTLIFGAKFQGPILTSPLEHAAVFEAIQLCSIRGRRIIYLQADRRGHISSQDLDPQAGLIVLSAANSETGVKNPIEEITAFAHQHQIPLILDGVALLGKESFLLPKGPVAMAFSGHKLHAPKGVGMIWASPDFPLDPFLIGGGQEFNRRSGTENLPGIIGFAKAVELLHTELPAATEKMAALRNLLESTLLQAFPSLQVNGTGPRLPNTTNLAFPDIDSEFLLAKLDQAGIAVSLGSACSSGGIEPSRVLLNMGINPRLARNSIRFSLSRLTTKEEIAYTLETLLPLLSKELCLQ